MNEIISEHFKERANKAGQFLKPQLTELDILENHSMTEGEKPLLAVEAECSQLLAPKCLTEFEGTVKYHSPAQLSLSKRGDAAAGK